MKQATNKPEDTGRTTGPINCEKWKKKTPHNHEPWVKQSPPTTTLQLECTNQKQTLTTLKCGDYLWIGTLLGSQRDTEKTLTGQGDTVSK